MEIRKLTETGLAEFKKYILGRREGRDIPVPKYLLDDQENSQSLNLAIEIENPSFNSRYEMGCYLTSLFDNKDIQPFIGDSGFWSWIALFWFDQLCPQKDEKFFPSKEYNYILSKNFRHRPRHSVYMTWQLVKQHGDDAHLMLCKEPSTRGEITEQMMSRQELLSSKGVVSLASRLYFDDKKQIFKKGAAARKSPGCVARYIIWLQQLQLTYDIFSMSKEELLTLLPKEFERFSN